MDGVKELVDFTNEALGENSKFVATDNWGKGYLLKERWWESNRKEEHPIYDLMLVEI